MFLFIILLLYISTLESIQRYTLLQETVVDTRVWQAELANTDYTGPPLTIGIAPVSGILRTILPNVGGWLAYVPARHGVLQGAHEAHSSGKTRVTGRYIHVIGARNWLERLQR